MTRHRRSRRPTSFFALVLLALLGLGSAACVPLPEGRNQFTGSLTVAAGEAVEDDINVFSGDVEVEDGGRVEGDLRVFSGDTYIGGEIIGDVYVFSGDVEIDGRIDGDLYAFSGAIDLGPEAEITGDVGTFASEPNVAEGASIGGQVGVEAMQGMDTDRLIRFGRPSAASRLLSALASALVMAVLAAIVFSMAPANVARAAATAEQQTLVAGGAGLLIQLVSIPLIIILAITICGIPIALIVVLLLVITSIFGHAALGQLVGRWLEPRIDRELSPLASTSLGAGALSLATGILGLIPCIGFIPGLLVGWVGLGAAALTVLGRRDYPAGPGVPPPAPDMPPPPPADGGPDDGGPGGSGIDWQAEGMGGVPAASEGDGPDAEATAVDEDSESPSAAGDAVPDLPGAAGDAEDSESPPD